MIIIIIIIIVIVIIIIMINTEVFFLLLESFITCRLSIEQSIDTQPFQKANVGWDLRLLSLAS